MQEALAGVFLESLAEPLWKAGISSLLHLQAHTVDEIDETLPAAKGKSFVMTSFIRRHLVALGCVDTSPGKQGPMVPVSPVKVLSGGDASAPLRLASLADSGLRRQ